MPLSNLGFSGLGAAQGMGAGAQPMMFVDQQAQQAQLLQQLLAQRQQAQGAQAAQGMPAIPMSAMQPTPDMSAMQPQAQALQQVATPVQAQMPDLSASSSGPSATQYAAILNGAMQLLGGSQGGGGGSVPLRAPTPPSAGVGARPAVQPLLMPFVLPR